MAFYLIVDSGKPIGISNTQQGTCFEIPDDRLQLEAYSIVDGQPVYDATFIKASEIRQQRDALLARSDWSQLGDIPQEIALEWQSYRQALRDVTDQPGFPDSVTFPSAPSA